MAVPLRILFWNAAGVSRQIDEFCDFVLRQNVDIILLCETFLKPANKLYVPNFCIYRNDRPVPPGAKAQGGVAVLVKNTIKHHVIPNAVTFNS